MSNVLRRVEEATPEWLTSILRRRGFLERGSVVAVRAASSSTLLVSNVSRLEVSYTPDASRDAPASLFLKLSLPVFQPEAVKDSSRMEVEFYSSVAPEMKDPPVPACFDAAFDPATNRAHLLLEDLSATHFQPPSPLPPSETHCAQAVEALAEVHAHWWEHPRLGAGVGEFLTEDKVEAVARNAAERFEKFADSLGDGLPHARRALYERVIECFPAPWRRLSSAKGLTLTHGDAHTWNFMYPRAAGRTLLIDWQLWHPHVGPRDLAFMMTLYWDRERRSRLEEKLLRRYHEALASRGVASYSWEQCLTDYRWAALRNIFVPVWQWAGGVPEPVWRPGVERALLAFEDLRCAELIEEG
ncbi:MAG TPA: phosphotransferase [Pyrinomonadaceae bacterium]|jgi:hypothetical protein|nr:phosphotransferase [Pyrinomonadaceae bacterium]